MKIMMLMRMTTLTMKSSTRMKFNDMEAIFKNNLIPKDG
jgi:hypothetical protein